LSDLHRWQAMLGVPFSELLPETGELALSNPVERRAQLVKAMKTAMTIQDRAGEKPIQRLIGVLIEQLSEIMPELTDVERWHGNGACRNLQDYGRAADFRLS
jgi:hypothetical protein